MSPEKTHPWICHALVNHNDGNIVLRGKAMKLREVLRESLLTFGQFTAPTELRAEKTHDAIDNHTREWPLRVHHGACVNSSFHLLLVRHASGMCDVFQTQFVI